MLLYLQTKATRASRAACISVSQMAYSSDDEEYSSDEEQSEDEVHDMHASMQMPKMPVALTKLPCCRSWPWR